VNHDESTWTNDDRRLVFKDHLEWLEFEHSLINHRITWLITSQALLFAALGLVLAAPVLKLVKVISWVGLAICIVMLLGLLASMTAKYLCYRDYKKFFQEVVEPSSGPPWGLHGVRRLSIHFGMRTSTTALGIVADLAVPVIFAVAWLYVLDNASSIVDAAERALRK
jgi:hypothetical protein